MTRNSIPLAGATLALPLHGVALPPLLAAPLALGGAAFGLTLILGVRPASAFRTANLYLVVLLAVLAAAAILA